MSYNSINDLIKEVEELKKEYMALIGALNEPGTLPELEHDECVSPLLMYLLLKRK